jgi:type VI secretion system secreted protein Hcp
MAQDIFLKLGSIKGESHDDKHKDEIEVLAWTWGVAQTGSGHAGGGAGVGKANFSDLTFTHRMDKASAALIKLCATGEHINEGTLIQRKAGKGQQEYLTLKMKDILVTSVQASAAGGQGDTSENVSLNFAKIDVDYKPQKADGSLDASIKFAYDIKANKEAA